MFGVCMTVLFDHCVYGCSIVCMFPYILLCVVFFLLTIVLCCFFFFKQKTAYGLRISDWSSDVCSSDPGEAMQALLHDKADKQQAQDDPAAGQKWVERLQAAAGGKTSETIQRTGLRLAAQYLKGMKNGQPLDPVARFHLGNGARIERVNWAADLSSQGLTQSCGIMTNYLYELEQLDENLAKMTAGKPNPGSTPP